MKKAEDSPIFNSLFFGPEDKCPVRRSLIPGTSGRYFCGSPGEGSAAAAAAAEAEAAAD